VISDVLKAVTSGRDRPAPPRLVQHPRPDQPARLNPAQSSEQVQAVTQRQIAQTLANLDAESATDLFFNMISRQPLEKREQTISNIMTRLGFEEDLESDQGGEYDEERDQGGRADQHTDSGSDQNTR